MVFGGYARHQHHEVMAASITTLTTNGKDPFVALADFNAPPDELRDVVWLDSLDAQIVTPAARTTCRQGRGSLMDCGIASNCLFPYIANFNSVEVPWSPHHGIRLRLHRSPRSVMVRAFVKPRAFEYAPAASYRRARADLNWHAAHRQAE